MPHVYVFTPVALQVGAVVSTPSSHACPVAATFSVFAEITSLHTVQDTVVVLLPSVVQVASTVVITASPLVCPGAVPVTV